MAKKNTPGLGIEYEVHVPAYFALLLNNNTNIEDFRLQSNVQEFGNLDDVLIDIRTKNGEELYFAFQLKHKQNEYKKLLPSNFDAKGDFNLEKYCKAFHNLKKENKKYHFILYTNRSFGNVDKKETTKFEMVPFERCLGKTFFDTSSKGANIYRFVVKNDEDKAEYEEFFKRFTLYTKQINFEELDKFRIMEILKYRELFLKYVDLFRKWHRGMFTNKIIDKKTLNIHLVDIFLSSYVIKNNFFNSSEEDSNLDLFKAAIREFDLVVMRNSKDLLTSTNSGEIFDNHFMKKLEDYLRSLKTDKFKNDPKQAAFEYLGKNSKIIDRTVHTVDYESTLKLLHYFFQKPLVINFNETSKNLIYETMKLFQATENSISFVLVGEEIDSRKFPANLRIFKNLQDLRHANEDLYREVIRNCKISIQGRKKISLEELIGRFDEIGEFVGPTEIFHMLKTDCLVGDQVELPEHYVSRTVSTVLINIQTICKYCLKNEDLIIIDFGGHLHSFQEVFQNMEITVIKIEDYLNEKKPSEHQRLLFTTDEDFSLKELKTICQRIKSRNFHFFRLVKEDNFLLVMSSNNLFKTGNLKKESIPEESIFNVCNAPVNILCSSPGMGKSTLLKYLKNECSSDCWTLSIDLKAHNYFLQQKHSIDDAFSHFMNLEEHGDDTFLKELKTIFAERRKFFILFDGLDEIESRCVNNVLGYIKELSLMGFRVWVSSRQNLQQKLEDYFNIFVIEINELNEDQQKKYIESRLRTKYRNHEIDAIISKIFTNVDVANNRQIIGVPLQLHIITQIFLDKTDLFENMMKDIDALVLTKIYRFFFEGRHKYSTDKLECQNPHLTVNDLEDYLEKYQVAALQSLFDEEIFAKLNLDLLLRRNRRFLEGIKTNKDPLGIIVGVNNKNKAVFEHFTFAEYFACEFLVQNSEKALILKEQLFSERYQNLFLIFNIMLAENSPLELSVIYQDTKQLMKLLKDNSVIEQDRNLLHIAASVGKRHPILNVERGFIIKDNIVKSFEGESSSFKEALEIMLKQKLDPFKVDKLFKMDCLEYALASGALYVVEAFLDKYGKPSDFSDTLRSYYDDANIAYYALRFGYPNLLSVVNKNIPLNNIVCSSLDYGLMHQSILRFIVMPECAKNRDIINIVGRKTKTKSTSIMSLFRKLFPHGKSLDNSKLNELLRFATTEGNLHLVDFIIRKGANLNFKGVYGQTALFFAVEQENFNMVSLLLARGADVNTRNYTLKTPLHHAAEFGNLKLVELLLRRGADVNAKKVEGKYVLESAARFGHLDVFNLLIKNGAKLSQASLNEAAIGGNVQIIEMYLEKCAHINQRNITGQTALHKAIINGRLKAVKFLVEKGADVNLVTDVGDTILHYAIFSKHKSRSEITEFLLMKGEIVNVLNIPNKFKATPLHLIVYRGRTDIVELLLDKGINLDDIDDSQDNDKYSLDFARKNGTLQKDLLLQMTRLIKKKQSDEKYFNPVEINNFLNCIRNNCNENL